MGIEYTNRCGDKYYLLQGKTKTGKPKYFMARKANGEVVEQIPAGFEIHEHPEQGRVTIRKIRPTNITAAEHRFLEEQTRILAGLEYFCVDIQDDSLVIYTPGPGLSDTFSRIVKVFGDFPGNAEAVRDWLGNRSAYHAMFRFTLANEAHRLFAVERWCFLGSIDDWFFLAGPKPLAQQAKTYLPHLTKESFYTLM